MRIKMEEENKQEPKLIKGVELKGIELVRFCYPNKTHNNYEWHDGENVDILPFEANGKCQKGGLYFTTLNQLLYYLAAGEYLGDYWVVTLTVDDNEDVWQEPNGKWKAHRVMVTSMTRIKDMPEEVLYQMATSFLQSHYCHQFEPFNLDEREKLWCKLLELRPHYLQFVRNQTYEMCQTSVIFNCGLIQFIYDPAIIVKLVSEHDLIGDITNWTCDLFDAFMASDQVTIHFQLCYDNKILYTDSLEKLKKMCNINEKHDYMLSVEISTTGFGSGTCIMYPTQELIDHIYNKVYQNNELLE